MRTEIKNNEMSRVEEVEIQLELLWTLLVLGMIDMNERNVLSTALQNELAEAKKALL